MTTKEPSAVVERMKIVAWLRDNAELPGNGFWRNAANAIERGDHDTAEPGLCPRTLEAAAKVADEQAKRLRSVGLSGGDSTFLASQIRALSAGDAK